MFLASIFKKALTVSALTILLADYAFAASANLNCPLVDWVESHCARDEPNHVPESLSGNCQSYTCKIGETSIPVWLCVISFNECPWIYLPLGGQVLPGDSSSPN